MVSYYLLLIPFLSKGPITLRFTHKPKDPISVLPKKILFNITFKPTLFYFINSELHFLCLACPTQFCPNQNIICILTNKLKTLEKVIHFMLENIL